MTIYDKDLGEIFLLPNIRARRLIARVREGKLQLTHPSSLNIKKIEAAIEEMRPALARLLVKSNSGYIFQYGESLQLFSFSVILQSTELSNLYHKLKDAVLAISLPQHFKLDNADNQVAIRQLVEAYMRKEAKRIFPEKLTQFITIEWIEISRAEDK